MRGFIIFLTLFFTANAWGLNHQEEIAKAQKWADTFNRPYPIVVIDRDVTNFLTKSNNASEDKEKRFELIKDYFNETANIDLSWPDFVNVDSYLSLLPNVAVALPITEGFKGKYKFCAVFVNAPNGNAQVETNRLIGFDQKEVYKDYPDFNYNNLNEKMSFEELYLFSLYHEVAHCIDDKFLVEMQEHGGDPHGIHLAEVYAETFAYFALLPRLGVKVASARALYRTIYSRIVGEFLPTQPTFGNPHIGSGGAIYNLGPYLYKAHELLHFQEVDLNRPLDQVTKEFVIRHGLSSREFHSIVSLLTQGEEDTEEQYRKWAFDNPHFFYSAYMEFIKYKEFTKDSLEYAFSTRRASVYKTTPELPVKDFCSAIKNKDLESYLETLNAYRQKINEEHFEISSINHTYKSLNELSIDCES